MINFLKLLQHALCKPMLIAQISSLFSDSLLPVSIANQSGEVVSNSFLRHKNCGHYLRLPQ
ncbi:hypothetical protein PM8797T_02594 [Gimesia maris DSM 8797]|nr:hypothetical protein PM8797T_02594 [Gimesia maris DSM 8797]|tara:strand:- start:47 stop:229 length:183 start_codon:yes stop_codon:yes gene_type:complete